MLAPLGTAARPVAPSRQNDFDLKGGIAAAIENLAGVNGLQFHGCDSWWYVKKKGTPR